MPHLGNSAAVAPRIQASSNSSLTTGATNDDVWTIWVGDTTGSITTGSTTSITATNTQIWTAWNRAHSTTAVLDSITVTGNQAIANQTTVITSGADNIQIWSAWNRVYSTGSQIIGPAPGRALSAEERQALETQRAADSARWEAQRRANEAEETKARERAEKLLQQSLDGKQRAELAANGYFELDVISKNGDRRRYRIHRKWSHSIQQVDPANGKRLKTLCIHPGMSVPIADSMLAQKLMLESGMEEELLRVANHS